MCNAACIAVAANATPTCCANDASRRPHRRRALFSTLLILGGYGFLCLWQSTYGAANLGRRDFFGIHVDNGIDYQLLSKMPPQRPKR